MAYIGQNADGNFTTSVSKDTFSGNDSTTVFTLSEAATTNTVDVFVENIRQEPTTAYTVDGTTLTFTAAPVTGTNNIYVVNRGPIQLSASHPAAQSLSAFSATITNDLTVDTNTLFVDSTNNSVGIGTTSPSAPFSNRALEVSGTGGNGGVKVIRSDAATAGGLSLLSGSTTHSLYGEGAKDLNFWTNATERMRIDSSGNLLVGKTSVGTGTAGVQMKSDGETAVTRSGTPFIVNRLTSDGDIAQFRKGGTTVGSIKCRSSGGNLQVDTVQSGIDFAGDGYLPMRNGSIVDNNLDIGSSSFRYNDLYLGGSVYLGGTAAANALDDYEKGTWTPTLTGTATALGTIAHASYVKVGRKVTAQAYLIFSSDTDTSPVKITMPFNSHNVSSGWQGGVIGYNTGFTGDHVLIQPNSNVLEIRKGSGGQQRLYSEYSSIGFIFGITYITA